MARPKMVRKPTEEKRSVSLWLSKGTVTRASRHARRRSVPLSLSGYAEEAISEKIARDEAALGLDRREGERRAS